MTESSQHIKTILNSIADGVFMVDRDMRVTSFNRAAQEITGFSSRDAVGRRCYEIFRASACYSSCPVKEALSSGSTVANREFNILARDNRLVPISASASALLDDAGQVIGAVETFRDQSLIYALKRAITDRFTFKDLVSRNPAMRRMFDVLPGIAASEATVLLRGESGTGKDVFARVLHDTSARSQAPFETLNCGALPEDLLEAELFGVEKDDGRGVTPRRGRLEMARGGTLFLDEIGDLPMALQAKLQWVLESREYQPIGSREQFAADVRFIASSKYDLEERVERGQFRRDLLHRIHVVSLQLPPLRERKEDIPLLIEIFLERFNRTYGKHIRGVGTEALQVLMNYHYPGNVRELLNLVEQSLMTCTDREIGIAHLPAALVVNRTVQVAAGKGKERRPSRSELEALLAQFQGNRTRVAEVFGVDRTTLWRWMKRHGLSD